MSIEEFSEYLVTNITKESYDNLSNLLFNNKIIDNKVDYNILVNNE